MRACHFIRIAIFSINSAGSPFSSGAQIKVEKESGKGGAERRKKGMKEVRVAAFFIPANRSVWRISRARNFHLLGVWPTSCQVAELSDEEHEGKHCMNRVWICKNMRLKVKIYLRKKKKKKNCKKFNKEFVIIEKEIVENFRILCTNYRDIWMMMMEGDWYIMSKLKISRKFVLRIFELEISRRISRWMETDSMWLEVLKARSSPIVTQRIKAFY